jgi:hypothetical protein
MDVNTYVNIMQLLNKIPYLILNTIEPWFRILIIAQSSKKSVHSRIVEWHTIDRLEFSKQIQRIR